MAKVTRSRPAIRCIPVTRLRHYTSMPRRAVRLIIMRLRRCRRRRSCVRFFAFLFVLALKKKKIRKQATVDALDVVRSQWTRRRPRAVELSRTTPPPTVSPDDRQLRDLSAVFAPEEHCRSRNRFRLLRRIILYTKRPND